MTSHESGKQELGGYDDSSFHLNLPGNAVKRPRVPIVLENGSPNISVEIEGISRSHWLQHINIATGHIKGNVMVTSLESYGDG